MSYTFSIKGIGETPLSGARPETTDDLIKKPVKNEMTLAYQAAKAQVEQLVQAGKVAEAWETISKFQEFGRGADEGYKNPLNIFQKDTNNGNFPFIGAHSMYASIRESIKLLYPGKVFYDVKGSPYAGAEHGRKVILVRPYHILLYRNGKVIKAHDKIEGQQPSKTVGGFARYETIDIPWSFEFTVTVNLVGKFTKSKLKDKKAFKEILSQAQIMGVGGRRGIGYGQWRIKEIKELR